VSSWSRVPSSAASTPSSSPSSRRSGSRPCCPRAGRRRAPPPSSRRWAWGCCSSSAAPGCRPPRPWRGCGTGGCRRPWRRRPSLDDGLVAGLLFLGVLPSTVQSCVVFTSVARGDVPGAVVSATVSNLAGIARTPLLAGAAAVLRRCGHLGSGRGGRGPHRRAADHPVPPAADHALLGGVHAPGPPRRRGRLSLPRPALRTPSGRGARGWWRPRGGSRAWRPPSRRSRPPAGSPSAPARAPCRRRRACRPR
jgi:hypothetical protein